MDTSVQPTTPSCTVATSGGSFRNDPDDRFTVRVVDDDSSVRQIASAMLAAFGYRALAAAEGGEVMQLLSASRGMKIDVLLTDYQMPAMLGDELARRVHEAIPSAAIVIMSGNFPEEVLTLPYHFLAKPFRSEDLREKLKAVFST